jgi:hypothetical protein
MNTQRAIEIQNSIIDFEIALQNYIQYPAKYIRKHRGKKNYDEVITKMRYQIKFLRRVIE